MFFRFQVFKGPDLSGSGSRVQIQVLEVAFCIYMEITLWQRYYPVNLLQISEHPFIRTPLKDCFSMFKLCFLSFCITSLIFYLSREVLHSSINWSVEAATGTSSTNKLYCILKNLLEEVQVIVVLCVVSLQIY